MTVLPAIEKRQTPKTHGVRFVGFHYKVYRDMTVYDADGSNGVDGDSNYCKGLKLTKAQDTAIGDIGSGDFVLRIEQDGTATFMTMESFKQSQSK